MASTNQQKPSANLQDVFLNAARKEKSPLLIHVLNGYQIKNAIVQGFDNYVLMLSVEGKQMLLYKHAISSITPEKRLIFNTQGESHDAE